MTDTFGATHRASPRPTAGTFPTEFETEFEQKHSLSLYERSSSRDSHLAKETDNTGSKHGLMNCWCTDGSSVDAIDPLMTSLHGLRSVHTFSPPLNIRQSLLPSNQRFAHFVRAKTHDSSSPMKPSIRASSEIFSCASSQVKTRVLRSGQIFRSD
jgi:hypothetical protein